MDRKVKLRAFIKKIFLSSIAICNGWCEVLKYLLRWCLQHIYYIQTRCPASPPELETKIRKDFTEKGQRAVWLAKILTAAC